MSGFDGALYFPPESLVACDLSVAAGQISPLVTDDGDSGIPRVLGEARRLEQAVIT